MLVIWLISAVNSEFLGFKRPTRATIYYLLKWAVKRTYRVPVAVPRILLFGSYSHQASTWIELEQYSPLNKLDWKELGRVGVIISGI